jgi:UDPglucose 6-dehydrogenase
LSEEFNVGIIGAGYVGLVTGACLAYVGHRVTCVDKDEGRVADLREGRMPLYEPGLEELVIREASQGRLSFSTDFADTVHRVDVLFIAVDTPQGDDGSADLSSVGAVARAIGWALAENGAGGGRREGPLIVVNKSTVPVGSGDYVSMLIQ